MQVEVLNVSCPYCGSVFATGMPERSPKRAQREPCQVECLPYTRDVGRFDPENEEDYMSPQGWRQVGKDFIHALDWERIGILRKQPGVALDVMYRVQYCPNCKRLFDIFANFKPDTAFADFWPHLFGAINKTSVTQRDISRYQGISWPIWLVRKMAAQVGAAKHPAVGAVLIGLIVFLIGILPWLLKFPALANDPLQLNRFFAVVGAQAIATIGSVIALILLERFVRKMQLGTDFNKLFRVQETRGINFWYNYTLCRFVGVQRVGEQPQITQVEIIGSGLALSTMLVVWLFSHFKSWFEYAISAAFVAVLILAFIIIRRFARRRAAQFQMAFLFVAGVACILLLTLTSSTPLETFRKCMEVLFWGIFAYFIGVTAWASMNSTLYILKGLTRIPMHLSPYDNFKNVKPLLDIQHFSTVMMMTLFVTLISLVSLFFALAEPLKDIIWIILWLQVAVTVLYAAIAVGVRPWMFLVSAVFIAITVFLYIRQPANPENVVSLPFVGLTLYFDTLVPFSQYPALLINPNLIALGAFLTIILYFHFQESRSVIRTIMAREKEEALERIDEQITQLRSYTEQYYARVEVSQDKNELFEYTQALHGLDALLNVRKTIMEVHSRTYDFMGSIVVPLFWSIFLPSIWNELGVHIIK